jgi:methionine aminopeptidase
MGIQSFGESFDRKKFFYARDVARDLTFELSSHIRPGMTENDAHQLYKQLCQKYPIQKQWHPPKIRLGPNTLKSFYDESVPHTLGEEDIFFIDIGPVVDGHEADFGETFSLGNLFEHKRIIECSHKVFNEVRLHWMKSRSEGEALYEFAKSRASHYGYRLNMGSDGHRIGDFPHQVFFKGSMIECSEAIVPDAWILEIHLETMNRSQGAFFEDVLTDDLDE